MSVGVETTPAPVATGILKPGAFVIVVQPHGLVMVGRWVQPESGLGGIMDGAIIRRWGTSNGLGQLAFEGPQESTVLDREPAAMFPLAQVIRVIPCQSAAPWIEALS